MIAKVCLAILVIALVSYEASAFPTTTTTTEATTTTPQPTTTTMTEPTTTTIEPTTTTTDSFSISCGPGWIYNSNDNCCYQVVLNTPKTWVGARSDCLARGGDLLSVSGLREQNFIQAVLNTGQYASIQVNFWIGATDQTTEGGWHWTDNSQLRYSNWHAGEPNNVVIGGLPEDCAEMMPSGNYQWNDIKCGKEQLYICKKNTTTTTTTEATTTTPQPTTTTTTEPTTTTTEPTTTTTRAKRKCYPYRCYWDCKVQFQTSSYGGRCYSGTCRCYSLKYRKKHSFG